MRHLNPFKNQALPRFTTMKYPGGQFTNLFQQAQSMGLAHRWHEITDVYADVNQLFGDIVKVTPSSKVVGDLTLFLVTNDIKAQDILASNREISFPTSVVEFFEGRLGQPTGGFPKTCRIKYCVGRLHPQKDLALICRLWTLIKLKQKRRTDI